MSENERFFDSDEIRQLTIKDLMSLVLNAEMYGLECLSPDTAVCDVIGEGSRFFMAVCDAAVKFKEAPAVIVAWIESGQLEAYKYRDAYVIPAWARPRVNMFKVVM